MSNSGCDSSLLEISKENLFSKEKVFGFGEWAITVVRARPVSMNGEKEPQVQE